MDAIKLGSLDVSRFILGGNPFSGFSHLTREMDDELRHYYTCARIKATYREAESLGITAHIGRADHHITRLLTEYWDEGGGIQWIAQTCPEIGSPQRSALAGIRSGAKAVFIHGGQMDHYLARGRLDEVSPVIHMIHDAGLPAGVAGHRPELFEWAEQHLDCDFYMCSYYNPIPRDETPENFNPREERYDDADRERMTAAIQLLAKPVIHYKILAAGRHEPLAAFRYAASKMRATDAVCVGICTKHRPNELRDDAHLLEKCLREVAGGSGSDALK